MRLAASSHDRSHRVALRYRQPRDLGAKKPSGAGHREAEAEWGEVERKHSKVCALRAGVWDKRRATVARRSVNVGQGARAGDPFF